MSKGTNGNDGWVDHGADADEDDDEATLAASSDVVAEIRRHAAELRKAKDATGASGESDAEPASPEPVVDKHEFDSHEPTTVTPRGSLADAARKTAPAQRSKPAAPKRVATTSSPGVSLIDGMAPPVASVDYWDTKELASTRVADAPATQAKTKRGRIPLWMLLAMAMIVLIVVSAAIVIAVVSGGGSA